MIIETFGSFVRLAIYNTSSLTLNITNIKRCIYEWNEFL